MLKIVACTLYLNPIRYQNIEFLLSWTQQWLYSKPAKRCHLYNLLHEKSANNTYHEPVAFRSSHTDNQRCIRSCRRGLWRVFSDSRSLASRKSPTAARTADRWPSLLLHTYTVSQWDMTAHHNKHWMTTFVWPFMNTNLGNFHREPLWVCLALCRLFSDNVLLECRPEAKKGVEMIQRKLPHGIMANVSTQKKEVRTDESTD